MSLDTAYLLSIGSGEDSRIYRTVDRGASWEMLFRNQIDEAFFDCFDFREDGSAFAFSDAVDGRFPLLYTEDGELLACAGPGNAPACTAG